MKSPIFSSIVVCSVAFGLLLSCGDTQAAPLTPAAQVTVTTLVRADGTPPTVIRLRRNEVFLFRGVSARLGDSVEIIFTKGGDSFVVATSTLLGVGFALGFIGGAGDIPLKGPATVTISGKGLVAFETQKL